MMLHPHCPACCRDRQVIGFDDSGGWCYVMTWRQQTLTGVESWAVLRDGGVQERTLMHYGKSVCVEITNAMNIPKRASPGIVALMPLASRGYLVLSGCSRVSRNHPLLYKSSS